jgi:biopolymer transport protein ExbD
MVKFSLSGMTDIVFLLLLFFMLTSTLIAPNALKLLIPQAGQTSEVIQKIPEVELRQSGVILVDGRLVNFDQLAPVLQQKLANQSDPSFKLITNPEVTVRETVKIMNVAATSNYKVVLLKK